MKKSFKAVLSAALLELTQDNDNLSWIKSTEVEASQSSDEDDEAKASQNKQENGKET